MVSTKKKVPGFWPCTVVLPWLFDLKPRDGRAFAVAAPKRWNDLPLHIKLTESLSVFKSHFKTHLFSLAF